MVLPERGGRRTFASDHDRFLFELKLSRTAKDPQTFVWVDTQGRQIFGPPVAPWSMEIYHRHMKTAWRLANEAGFVAPREIGELVFGRHRTKSALWRTIVRRASRKMPEHWHCVVRFPSPRGWSKDPMQFDPRYRNVFQSSVMFDPKRGVEMMEYAINQEWWPSFFEECVKRWRLEGASTQHDRRKDNKEKYFSAARPKDWRGKATAPSSGSTSSPTSTPSSSA